MRMNSVLPTPLTRLFTALAAFPFLLLATGALAGALGLAAAVPLLLSYAVVGPLSWLASGVGASLLLPLREDAHEGRVAWVVVVVSVLGLAMWTAFVVLDKSSGALA